MRRTAGRSMETPARVLVIQLVPALTLARLLRRLRGSWPAARLMVLSATAHGEEAIAELADEVILTKGLGVRGVIGRLRQARPEVTIVAGGADYGLRRPYLKAAALARLSGARGRWQWEPGEAPDRPLGGPLARALRRGVRRWQWEPRATPSQVPAGTGLRRWVREASSGLASLRRRRYYRRPPTCGPREVQIAVTAACNYHCLMCAFHNPAVDDRHKEAQLPRMSYEMFARLAAELRQHRVMLVGLTGYGEPLTHPQAMDMIACALELGLYVVPTTNASLITEERARRLVDLGLPRMHVSLNAGTDETYARMHWGTPPGRLGEIVSRLRWMAEYAEKSGLPRTEVRVSSVITRLNMHEIPEMVRAAHQARSGELALLLMSPVDGQQELLPRPDDWPPIRQAIREARLLGRELGVRLLPERLEEEAGEVTPRQVYQHIPCYMGYEVCQIIADGSVLFCAECLTPLGNLHESDFTSIWGSEAYQRARRAALDLPRTRRAPGTCRCFEGCCHTGSNLDVHRWLYGEAAVKGIG